jgi:ATP-dependent DNA ligase
LKLPTQSAYIDGGSVQIRPDGTTATHHKETTRLIYFAFDLLFIDGEDLMASPLIERKRRLKALLRRVPKNIYFRRPCRRKRPTVVRRDLQAWAYKS